MAIFIDFNAWFNNICVTIVTIKDWTLAPPWLDLSFTFVVLIKISTFTCPNSASPFVWHVWVHLNNNATRLDKWRDYAISFAISHLQAPPFGTYALFETHNWWLLGGRTQNKTCLVHISKYTDLYNHSTHFSLHPATWIPSENSSHQRCQYESHVWLIGSNFVHPFIYSWGMNLQN